MKIEEFINILGRVKYKEHSLLVYSHPYLIVKIAVKDIDGDLSVDTLTAQYKVDVSCLEGEVAALTLIFDAIVRVELHEMHEWFKLDNKQVYNPHALT